MTRSDRRDKDMSKATVISMRITTKMDEEVALLALALGVNKQDIFRMAVSQIVKANRDVIKNQKDLENTYVCNDCSNKFKVESSEPIQFCTICGSKNIENSKIEIKKEV